MRQIPLKQTTISGITLGTFALLGVLLLGGVKWITQDDIAENQRQRHLLNLHAIVKPSAYDNDLLGAVSEHNIESQHLAPTITVYSARLGRTEIAKIYHVTSVEGYSGAISLLIGVNTIDQSLRGVRVIAHKETPGLGDKIETNKSDWILQFSGKSLNNPLIEQWKVKKDGGRFDEFTGATITPRAVVNAVLDTLKLAAQQQHTSKSGKN